MVYVPSCKFVIVYEPYSLVFAVAMVTVSFITSINTPERGLIYNDSLVNQSQIVSWGISLTTPVTLPGSLLPMVISTPEAGDRISLLLGEGE